MIQDLEAHLSELADAEVISILGTSDEFVAEFRASAGLSQRVGQRRETVAQLARLRHRLATASGRLAEATRWQSIRHLWVWTRGWLLVSAMAVLSQTTPFERFPIPSIDGQLIGLLLVFLATWVSLLLDQRRSPLRDFSSVVFSTAAVIALAISLIGGIELSRPGHDHLTDELLWPDQLISSDGNPVTNIYAYDETGNPVSVLLFDQDGRPLLSLPSWVYADAESNPGVARYDFGGGLVSFPRDQFGRAVTNLYPLDTYRYDGDGVTPVSPPDLGLPLESVPLPDEEGVVRTTIGTSP